MADHMTAEQLLTCPFCDRPPNVRSNGFGRITIECELCGVTMRRRIPNHYPEHWTRERVIGRWNNRPGAARLSGMAAVQWQPIETAPRTGQAVLLYWRSISGWRSGYYCIDDEFESRPKHWKSPEHGWRCDGDQCIPRNQSDCTHWMPLPAAPEPPHV